MRWWRSFGATLLLCFVCMGLLTVSPGRADAQYRRWDGWHRDPYYWNGGYPNR